MPITNMFYVDTVLPGSSRHSYGRSRPSSPINGRNISTTQQFDDVETKNLMRVVFTAATAVEVSRCRPDSEIAERFSMDWQMRDRARCGA